MRKHYYQDNDEDALVLWTENIESPEFVKLMHERVLYLKSRGEFADLESAESFPEIKSNGKSSEPAKPSRRSAQQTVSRSTFKGADEC